METIVMQDRNIDVTGDGYLLMPELWNEEVARLIASSIGIQELNEKHWAIIHFVRQHWERNGTAPLIRNVCQHTGIRLGMVYELFPMGPAKGACRIAGLPRPDGCV